MNETTKIERFWEWVTTARKFTINLLFLLIVLIILFSILGSIFSSNKLPDPEGKALVFNPEGPIVEQVSGLGPDPISILLSGLPTPEVSVRDVLFTLEAAQKDERIEHVILSLDNIYGTGQTVLYDVGQALKKLKDSGKNIVAIADYYDQSSYYLASFANEIILHPDGGVAIDGYSTVRLYYKSFIDKLEVTVNLFRVGKYKSAMEPYIRDNMSEADKEARLAYLKILWDSWKNVVSENREIQANTIQSYADNLDEYMLAEGGNG
ncbi:MAG TPA: signal peptide peptidase SppA, partial [Gammaproteobacteria bacterium]|nr:signal peptide peptidase SppA [Gammaproteobacteria bacterium]